MSGASLSLSSRCIPATSTTRPRSTRSVEAITRELARQGYAFSDVRPHGERDNANHTIALAFTIDDAPKVYIERIDIVGNTRTRDYVIRREFDIGEGDPYNHAMVERGERRLNNLGFFKSVHISTRPGSAPDRVIVTVAGRGQADRLGQPLRRLFDDRRRRWPKSPSPRPTSSAAANMCGSAPRKASTAAAGASRFTEPYLPRPAPRRRLRHLPQAAVAEPVHLYETKTTGVNLRLGVPITDELTFQPNYSLYESQIIIPNTQLAAVRRLRQHRTSDPASAVAGTTCHAGSSAVPQATTRTTTA